MFQLNSDAFKGNQRKIKTLNVFCVKNVQYRYNFACKKHHRYNDSKNDNDKESILMRMPCDVFLSCVCEKYLYPNEIFLLLTVSKNIYKLLSNGSLNTNNSNKNNNGDDKCNGNSLLHRIISKQRLCNYFCQLVNSLNAIGDAGPIVEKNGDCKHMTLCDVDDRTRYTFILSKINRFRKQIRDYLSICRSMICWLNNINHVDGSNTSACYYTISNKMSIIIASDNDYKDLSGKLKEVVFRFFVVEYYLGDQHVEKIDSLQALLSKVIERIRILFILAVSQLKWIQRNDHNRRRDDKSLKIEIYFQENILDELEFKELFTASTMEYMSSACDKNIVNMKLSSNSNRYRLVLKSNVESISIYEAIKLHFNHDNIANWSNNNKAIIWDNHEYSFDYPMWNQYFVNVGIKLNNGNSNINMNGNEKSKTAIDRLIVLNNSNIEIKIDGYKNIKCLCLNKVFKHCKLSVDESYCPDKFDWIRFLTRSKQCNCAFLVVGVDTVQKS